MKERGQVSIFIILAFVVVVALGLFFIFNQNGFKIKTSEKIKPEILPIQLYVQNCIKEVGDNAIYNIGQNGGYYKLPDPYLTTVKNETFSYYFYESKNIMPSKEKIEQELSNYVNDNLVKCTQNFEGLNEFSVNAGNVETNTLIESNKVSFNVNYPLSINKGENSYEIEEFNDNIIYVRLGVIYDGASKYMSDQEKNVDNICITCLDDIANESDLYFNMLDYNASNIIFIVTDKNSKINDQNNYTFKFANMYEQ